MERSLEVEAEPTLRGSPGPALLAGVAVASVLFYTLAFGHRNLRMPAGDDGMFYVVSLRSVAHLGLADPQIAARPGFPLVGSILGAVTGSSPWAMAVGAPIAFAAATGFAAAAIARRWRLHGHGLAAFAFLAATSGVIARLVAGKVENLMALWLMAAVLAVAMWSGELSGRLASWRGHGHEGGDTDSRPFWSGWLRRGIPAAALMCATTLVEWPLAVTFAAILAAAWLLSWLVGRRASATGGGIEDSETTLRLLVLASLAGLGVGLLAAFVWSGAGSGIQNLPPSYRYGARLREELSLVRPWVTAPLVAVGLWVAAGRERRPPALTVVLSVWLAGTVAVLAAGWAGVPGPTYRALTIALPVVLAASAAPLVPFVRAGRRRRPMVSTLPRWCAVAAATGLTVAALAPGALFWWQATLGTPTSVEQLSEVSAVARYAHSLPAGAPPVVLVVGRIRLPFAESLLYSRMAASVLPPGEPGRVLVFVGRVEDALAGRPSTGMGPGEDAVLRRLFSDVEPALAAGCPILSGRDLDPDGYRSATSAGAPLIGGRSVAVVRGPNPAEGQSSAIRVVPVPAWPQLTVVSLLVLLVLGAAGLGWSTLWLPAAPREIRLLMAPAFGAASLAVIALILVHAGVRPSGGGAWATLALSLVAGGGAWARGRREAALHSPQ
jgi:hypothetical protein